MRGANNTDDPVIRRRVVTRRNRSGMRSSSSSGREGVTFRNTPDEIDDLVDPEVEASNRPPPPRVPRIPPMPSGNRATQPSSPDLDVQGGDDDIGATPAQRLAVTGMAGDGTYAQEYRLTLVQRMLMRRMPLDRIAAALQVSLSTVMRDRKKLNAMLRERSQSLNIDQIIGEQLEFYADATGNAMRMMDQSKNSADGTVQALPAPIRLAAIRTALTAQADKAKFLQVAGVFDAIPFRRSETGGAMTDVQALMQMTMNVLNSDTDDAGGFGDLEFGDDGEVIDL